MANHATPAPDAQPPVSSTCPDCTGSRYCARLRCYCGHEVCPAFASYVDLNAIPLADSPTPTKSRKRSSWDDRKESTWIDSL